MYRLQCPDIEWGRDVQIEGKLVIRGQGRVVIGDGCVFLESGDRPNTIAVEHADALVIIGAGTSLNGTAINALERVAVGHECTLGPCSISDSDYHPVDPLSRIHGEGGRSLPVTIGDRVWLATGVIVLKGVTVGDEAVVGAGAVIRSSVPPRTVVVGDAQRVVKEF